MTDRYESLLYILAKAGGAALYWQLPVRIFEAIEQGVVRVDDNDLAIHPNAIGPDEHGQYYMPHLPLGQYHMPEEPDLEFEYVDGLVWVWVAGIHAGTFRTWKEAEEHYGKVSQ